MEYGSRLRFALITIGGIVLLILSIWGITSLARRVIGTKPSTSTSTVKKTDLATYNKDSSFVRVTVKGPIVANEKFQSYQIEVGQNYRDFKIFTGYNNQVVVEERLSNDKVAYDNFLKSLKQYSYTSKTDEYSADETGQCATGKRYIYELFDNSKTLQRTWDVSCNNSVGTFTGSGISVRSLFKKQIPNFTKLATDSKLTIE